MHRTDLGDSLEWWQVNRPGGITWQIETELRGRREELFQEERACTSWSKKIVLAPSGIEKKIRLPASLKNGLVSGALAP